MRTPFSKIPVEVGQLLRWHRTVRHDGLLTPQADEQPLRAELYSEHQLEQHAKALATLHELAPGRGRDRLIARLAENEQILVLTYYLLSVAVEKNYQITPAAEWLLDNFHVIEEQIRTIRRHLPGSYSRTLPQLNAGPAAGLPRVFGIVTDFISHVDGSVDVASLGSFIAAYQENAPLTLGELWAVPIILRLSLIENLRRLAMRQSAVLRDRDAATEWADRMVGIVERNPTDLILVLADMARANPPLSSAFVTELTRHLHGQSPHFAFVQSWLEHRLAEQGLTIAQLVQMESRAQAADQMSIANSITSLRLLAVIDWRDFVESQSVVERILQRDPLEAYEGMAFVTRDAYRHAVEQVSRRCRLSEAEVAHHAVRLAELGAAEDTGGRTAHVGYYLLDKGRAALERAACMRSSPVLATRKFSRRFALPLYLLGIALLTAGIAGAFAAWTARDALTPWMRASLAVPVLVCSVHAALACVNWFSGLISAPRLLSRMDFRKGIPSNCRTMVVVPTIISDADSVDTLLDRIEVDYAGNHDPRLHFALLTDFRDAAEATLPEDAALLQRARDGINALNRKYQHDRADIFYLFHRPRRWNPRDSVWMGYERKRGKLQELNALLRGGAMDCFSEIVGDASILPHVRYIITLDADTQLPRDTACELIGAMAHPLNRPMLDAQRRRVVDGYGILQPRVATNLATASRSWFVRLFAADSGLDPYTRAVSDIYQDLFGEGSFIGKGIYDVDVFNQTCAHFPEDTILSHDLIESAFARSALMSDVELYEDHPSSYAVDSGRRHRWMRGDWQIARWLLPRVPGAEGRAIANPISTLARWKMLDNLRRSLVAPSMLLLLVCDWLLPMTGEAVLFVIAIIAAPPLLASATELLRRPSDVPLRMHLQAFEPTIIRRVGQVLFTLVLLPYEAYLSLDAIARSTVRTYFTRRKLLEWTTSSDAARRAHTSMLNSFLQLWMAPSVAMALFTAIVLIQPASIPASAALLTLWVMSPAVAWGMSRTIVARPARLSKEQHVFLRRLARRTWRYYEVFVNADENWLPPDNYQERPEPTLATRTSPTNIGVAMLANLAAHDFGFCSAAQVLRRTQHTLDTLGRMERYRGHFYNWYDTRSLDPLPPRYVSTVDSGNLAVYLAVLRSGLLELMDAEILSARTFEGLRDTAGVLAEVATGSPAEIQTKDFCDRLGAEQPPDSPRASFAGLQSILASVANIAALGNTDLEFTWWLQAIHRDAADHRDDLIHFAPWTLLPPPPEDVWTHLAAEQVRLCTALHDSLTHLERNLTLRQVAALQESLLPLIGNILADIGERAQESNVVPERVAATQWLTGLRVAIEDGSRHAAQRIRELEAAAEQCHAFTDMDFTFLVDSARDLMSIGYNVNELRLDVGFYDLLASEARHASYFAVARGQVGQEHWFALRRMLTTSKGAPALLSWNGSMFEYLMPLLVMPTYENTLLDQTCKAIVSRQIDYGRRRNVPWGISESGYNALDVNLNYLYRGFGVPGLGLKRGLAEDLVIAPYAAAMALMVSPEAACQNLQRLTADGRQGAYGFYEAIDYTPSRMPRNAHGVTIRSFMAHHEGMSLLSLAYALLNRPMQRRFLGDPTLRATDLLLQERIPKAAAPIYPHAAEAGTTYTAQTEPEPAMRIIRDPSGAVPEVHLLSNGRYHVMVSSAGSGYSRWRDIAVTRWRADTTRDCWGSFCYLRDVESGHFWSIGHQPSLKVASPYEVIFSQAKAEFRRRDDQIETHMEISVSPEDDIELRRITITNHSDRVRTIDVTSYAEVVLAAASQDLSHPAFSNLFVQTEFVQARQAILCTRRPRSEGEQPPWMVHLITVQGSTTGKLSFETDRMKFIGRGRTLVEPAALDRKATLSNSQGSVLDPIVSLRHAVRIQPNESARVDLVTGVAETREAAVALADKYDDPRLADRVFELAWTHSQVALRHLNATEGDVQIYDRLASSVIYPASLHRSNAGILARNRRTQSGLWGYGISGDLPIVLLRIRDRDKLDLVRQVFQVHAYWRMKGLIADLVVWNEDDSVYRQDLHDTILGLIAASPEAGFVDKPGGVFLRRGEQIPDEDRVLLQAASHVVLMDDAGTLREQVDRRRRAEPSPPLVNPMRPRSALVVTAVMPQRDLAFSNGFGGFTQDGREYVTVLRPGHNTPAPWINVIANAQFGTIVSESGGGYTWADNCHEFRLTPWTNDSVGGSGEAFYIRDEETGQVWSPSPHPARGASTYVVRHGFGYSTFEYEEGGLATKLTMYVATDASVKFARLKITNKSGRPRRLSATAYWELVLGELRSKTLMHVMTEIDPVTGAIFARNPYSNEFSGKVAFADTSELKHTLTTDRTEFIGRNGTPASPAAMQRQRLSGRVGTGFDPCAALQVSVLIEAGQEKEVVFILGAAQSDGEARQIIQRHRGVANANRALEEVQHYWARTFAAVQIETPDKALDFLVNGWLPYQTLACRMWARTGFYQSGGAYGFRDQLQDAMALLHIQPALFREHLLRAAARQFREGDVQHWWHAHSGRGSRTHCSDDFLWLPYAVCRYVTATGDTGVLDERVPFLEGRAVRTEEEGYYDLPQISGDVGTLYEHCVRAINRGLRLGVHGLPLMGSSDWNDGMNLVGAQGKGESVWLAFFTYDVLTRFAKRARQRGDDVFADKCLADAAALRASIDESAWDGAWYRRAYFDSGEPLGSAENTECQIDSLPQSWAVLSGAGDPARAQTGMDSLYRRLVHPDLRLVQLFDPPFDKSHPNPGYIMGYSPGVRENGGQYTHAAIWAAMAFAEMGDAERAWELFGLLNPINLGATAERIGIYKAEPYVVAADVYAAPPHTGRGGWTWYTGSSGWMYQLVTESLLGLRLEVDMLRFVPCIPPAWPSFKIHYRYRETMYHITFRNAGGGKVVNRVVVDGASRSDLSIHLIDDRNKHHAEVLID